jgi:hypothetical protein
MFLCTLAVFEKGAFGELEAVLTLTVFVSTAALLFASRAGSTGARVAWSAAAGLGLAAALLTKGPPALVFFFAAVIAIAIAGRRPRYLASPWPWLALVVGAALAGVWTALLLARPEVGDAVGQWGKEMARSDDGVARYWHARRKLASGVLVGFFPASVLWLIGLGTAVRREVLGEEAQRFAGWTVALGLAFFALMPGTATRYVHPLVPWACLAAGRVLAAALEERDAVHERRLRRLGRVVAGLGVAVAGGAAWVAFDSIAAIDHLSPVGWALAACTLVASIAGWRAWSSGSSPRALWLAFGVLAGARLIQLTEVVPQSADRRGREASARRIAEHVPAGAPLHVALPYHYNTLFYVRRRMIALDDARDAPPGAAVVVLADAIEALRGGGLVAERVVTVPTHEGDEISLLRLAK